MADSVHDEQTGTGPECAQIDRFAAQVREQINQAQRAGLNSNGPKRLMRATEFCERAASLVGGERDRQHGAKYKNFQNIATLWEAWLNVRVPGVLTPHDVAQMMILMKAARTQTGDFNEDDYVDQAGYSGCAGEVQLHDLLKDLGS